jgi:hypothetical protein
MLPSLVPFEWLSKLCKPCHMYPGLGMLYLNSSGLGSCAVCFVASSYLYQPCLWTQMEFQIAGIKQIHDPVLTKESLRRFHCLYSKQEPLPATHTLYTLTLVTHTLYTLTLVTHSHLSHTHICHTHTLHPPLTPSSPSPPSSYPLTPSHTLSHPPHPLTPSHILFTSHTLSYPFTPSSPSHTLSHPPHPLIPFHTISHLCCEGFNLNAIDCDCSKRSHQLLVDRSLVGLWGQGKTYRHELVIYNGL